MRPITEKELREGQIVFYKNDRTYIARVVRNDDRTVRFIGLKMHEYWREGDREQTFDWTGTDYYIYFRKWESRNHPNWQPLEDIMVNETLVYQNEESINEILRAFKTKLQQQQVE